MIGIKALGSYIPSHRIANIERFELFGTTPEFITQKIGIASLARKSPEESVADMCLKSFEALHAKYPELDPMDIDCLVLCTQNGDYRLPHTSSVLQAAIPTSSNCAVFDISLGCSGYVYGLGIVKSFMEANGLGTGLLFTCDPYSSILDPQDKNTELLFGDAATVTLLTNDACLGVGRGVYLNDGSRAGALMAEHGKKLTMNGQEVFSFAMRHVPGNIRSCLEANSLATEEVDIFLLHQASKYMLINLIRRLKLEPAKVPLAMGDYGNTVSSSIPLLLEQYLEARELETFLLCGFGVGLGSASVVLRRVA